MLGRDALNLDVHDRIQLHWYWRSMFWRFSRMRINSCAGVYYRLNVTMKPKLFDSSVSCFKKLALQALFVQRQQTFLSFLT